MRSTHFHRVRRLPPSPETEIVVTLGSNEGLANLAQAITAIPSPPATMFVWAPVPERFREQGSLAFSKRLLREANVATAPSIGSGECSEDHVWLALVETRHRLRQMVRNVKRLLTRHGAVAEPSRARAVA